MVSFRRPRKSVLADILFDLARLTLTKKTKGLSSFFFSLALRAQERHRDG